MGGHGFYVWSCYLLTALIFVGLFMSVNMQHKKQLSQIRRRSKREDLSQQKNQKSEVNQTNPGDI
jgi:heme exporter protein CcmD